MPLELNIAARFLPREPRKAVRLEAILLLPDDREIAVMLTNISRSGFTACSDEAIDPQTILGVAVPGCGIRRAEVRWCEAGELGARFEDELTETQVLAF